jgi:hypothetical protein
VSKRERTKAILDYPAKPSLYLDAFPSKALGSANGKETWTDRGRSRGYKVAQRAVVLTLKGEAGTNLVGSLVQVLGVKRGAETESDTRAEQNVVGKSSNTTVVDLDLY